MNEMSTVETWHINWGEVQYQPGPPIITVAGYPALPGEDYRDYARRLERELLARVYGGGR